MSFSSGVFTLVAGNPVVTGTTVSSTWANNTLNDIATGLSTCVLKDGTQTTTAQVPFVKGLKIGTATGTGATTNDAVLKNGGLLRSDNNAGSSTLALISADANDNVQLGSGVSPVRTRYDTPPAGAAALNGTFMISDATPGDFVIYANGVRYKFSGTLF